MGRLLISLIRTPISYKTSWPIKNPMGEAAELDHPQTETMGRPKITSFKQKVLLFIRRISLITHKLGLIGTASTPHSKTK